jgi:antitoxin CcdA
MRQSTLPGLAKSATNISLSREGYNEGELLGVNTSQTHERLLREEASFGKECRWAQEHARFIAAYNQTVEADGLALEQWRGF